MFARRTGVTIHIRLLHVDARKSRLYELTADYRNMAYFNALPSFADPLLSRGLIFSERTFDIRRRLVSVQLDFRPGSTIIPFVAYERSSGYGRGVTTFVSDANEYPVPNRIRDSNDTYRGGVRFEFRRFHATGEIGETVFKDDQQVFESSPRNFGNRETPFLGQALFLTNLQQSYGVRGSGVFTEFIFTSNAFSWLDLYGNFCTAARRQKRIISNSTPETSPSRARRYSSQPSSSPGIAGADAAHCRERWRRNSSMAAHPCHGVMADGSA